MRIVFKVSRDTPQCREIMQVLTWMDKHPFWERIQIFHMKGSIRLIITSFSKKDTCIECQSRSRLDVNIRNDLDNTDYMVYMEYDSTSAQFRSAFYFISSDMRHEKTNLKVFVIVIHCHTLSHARPSFILYDNDKDLKVCFLMMCFIFYLLFRCVSDRQGTLLLSNLVFRYYLSE